MQWIAITHPDLSEGNQVTVTLEAFEELHEKKGWVIVEVDEKPEAAKPKQRTFEPAAGTLSSPSKLKSKKATKLDSGD